MTEATPALRRHLFLTGEKQVGKSTLLRKLIDRRALECTGFETRAFYLEGERRGFTLRALNITEHLKNLKIADDFDSM